jgi:hypothetical protein
MGSVLSVYVRRWNSARKFEPWMLNARPYDLAKNRTSWEFISERSAIEHVSDRHNIDLNAGRDFIHDQSYIAASVGTAVLQYIALSESTHTPTATDTTLTGEITDSNGLARAQASTDSHTAGTNTSTIGNTFNATGSYVAVQLGMIFTASSGGTGNNEATFSSTNLNAGDSLQTTWTVTLG